MIGLELIAPKEECEHGDWLPWLKDEFGWSSDTAQNYIRVAKAFGNAEAPRHLDGFAITGEALYLLSAPAIPAEVR